MKTVRGKPIETAVGQLLPSMRHDLTTGGDEINAGSMFMTMQGGTATTTHKGKKVKIDFTSVVPTGATLLRAPNGRQFLLSLEKVITHAIDNGLLDDTIRFEPDNSK